METYNTKEYLEDLGNDFAGFIGEKNWKDAHAIIANLDEKGFTNEASALRKDLNKAQFEHLENGDLKLNSAKKALEEVFPNVFKPI